MSHVGPKLNNVQFQVCKHPGCDIHPQKGYLCSAHAREDLGLEIKDSLIEGAGKGLFATRDFKKGQAIDYYGGKLITSLEGQNENKYILEVSKKVIIDGSDPHSSFIRFANSARSRDKPKLNNAVLKGGKPFPKAVCIKGIAKGDEIYLRYGRDYWTNIDNEERDKSSALKQAFNAGNYAKKIIPKKSIN